MNVPVFIIFVLLIICIIVISTICYDKTENLQLENGRLNSRVDRLYREMDDWRDKALLNRCEADKIRGQIELYEKIANKFLCDQDATDSIFMFEGKYYYPVSFVMGRDLREADTLDVEFVAADMTVMKKGENKCR